MGARARGPQPGPPGRRWARLLGTWATVWTALLVTVFLVVTVLTVTLWATDPEYTETTPVADLSFLVLGAMIALGFAAHRRSRDPGAAGACQPVLAGLALVVAGALGGRVEPALGGSVLVVAALVLVALTPDGLGSLRPRGRPDLPSVVLVLVAVPPAAVYATHLIGLARSAGPSCFLGACAHGDRFAEMAATSGAVVALGALSAVRPSGWRLPAWSAGVGAGVVGASSLAVPEAPGALGGPGAVLVILWAATFLVVAQRRPDAVSGDRPPTGPDVGGPGPLP